MQHKLTLAALCTLATSLSAQTIANFSFDNADLISSQPSFATVTDLHVSNSYMFGGGGSDLWLCLTTAWNHSGGTLSFTVTPNAGTSIDYDSLRWNAITANASVSDSVRAATVKANGLTLEVIDPLSHNTTHDIDLEVWDFLQGNVDPVTFEIEFEGNPTGQSAYEIGFLELRGGPCIPTISGATPNTLPTITNDCYILDGTCFDQILGIKFDGVTIPGGNGPYNNYGMGFYTILSPTQLKVCPPFCRDEGSYEIRVITANGEATTNVGIHLTPGPVVACQPHVHVGAPQCVFISSGQLPGPNNLFLAISRFDGPTVVPGVINLDIGNQFQSILCVTAPPGECVQVCLGNVPGAWLGTNNHFQAIAWNFGNFTLPLPVSPVCTTTYIP